MTNEGQTAQTQQDAAALPSPRSRSSCNKRVIGLWDHAADAVASLLLCHTEALPTAFAVRF